MGVFEGKYLNDTVKEFPKEWFTEKTIEKMHPEKRDAKWNYYKVKSRQSLQTWISNGWIPVDGDGRDKDVRGWFQWYCRFRTCLKNLMISSRYYMGRRIPGVDEKQISR